MTAPADSPQATPATDRLRAAPLPSDRGPTPHRAAEPTLAQLSQQIKTDVSQLVSQEMELAKLELGGAARRAGIGAGLLAAAALSILVAWVLIAVAIADAIHRAGLPIWAGLLIAAGGYLLVAGLMGLVGGLRLKSVKPPQRTVATMKANLAALRGRSG